MQAVQPIGREARARADRLSGPQAVTLSPAAAGDSTGAQGAGMEWRQTAQPIYAALVH